MWTSWRRVTSRVSPSVVLFPCPRRLHYTEVIHSSAHVSVGHHTDLPDNCDYFYRKMVVFNPGRKPGGGKAKTTKVPYITAEIEED